MNELERAAEAAWEAVFADPAGHREQAALVADRARVAGDMRARVLALRAVGWAARELGDHDAARYALDTAVRLARRHRVSDRLAEALVTRAGLHLELGRPQRALADLDDAAAAEGRTTIEIATQRAVVLDRLGRYTDAVNAYERAAPAARTATAIERCKYLNNMAGLLAEIGRHDEAIVALDEAAVLASRLGPSAQAIVAHNHAGALLAAGRVGDALARYADAETRFAEAGVPLIEHHLQRLDALLALRLGEEAVEAATRVMAELDRSDVAFLRGDAHLNLARAHLMRNDPGRAKDEAEQAATIYRQQHRPALAATADVVEGHAALASGAVDDRHRRAVGRAAALLRRRGVTAAAAEADLLAGRLALAEGRGRAAVGPLQRAAGDGRSGPASQRIGGAVAAALLAELAGDRPRAARAARVGLTYLDDFRASTASIELGARVSGHGEELARIGLGAALAGRRPERVHDWLEAWRGRALVATGVGAGDEILADLLARLRHVIAERAQVLDDAATSAALERHQATLEIAIRSRARVTGRLGSGASRPPSLGAARELLGPRALVEYGVHDGEMFAVVVANGKATLRELGAAGPVDDEIGHLMSGLRRVAVQATRGRDVTATTAALRHSLAVLDAALVAPLGELGDGPIVVVPTAALLALPWGSLDRLRARTVSVSPSVTVWTRAVTVERRRDGVVLVAGPRLPHAADEIAAVAAVTAATTVTGDASTTTAVLDAFRRADLVHLACHGHLRSDNPMFSSLELADGPLTVYDLEAVDPFARRVVLAACSSGASSIHAGDELIGVLSTLLANGAAAVVASSVLVPDLSTKELMVALHRSLATGESMATALSDARRAVDDDDPAMLVASLAFSCYGAGIGSAAMRAAVMTDWKLTVEDVPDPVPRAGQVLAKVLACGICGSDLHLLQHGAEQMRLRDELMADTPADPLAPLAFEPSQPLVMGHEFCCEIVEVGQGVERGRVGDVVVSMPGAFDDRGIHALGYSNLLPGGYSELMVLNDLLILPVPKGIAARHAALTEPLAVGVHAVNKSRIDKGDAAIVLGCGPVGLAVIASLASRGIGPIVAADFSPARRRLAEHFGAHVVVDPREQSAIAAWRAADGQRPLVIFEAVGVPGMIDQAMRAALRDTRIVVVGVCMQQDHLQPMVGILRELSVQFVLGYTPEEFAATLDAIADGALDLDPLVTGTVGVDGVPQAFRDLANPEAHAKILVEPGAS